MNDLELISLDLDAGFTYDARGKILQLIPSSQASAWGWQPFAYAGLGALKSNEQKALVYDMVSPRDNTDSYVVDPVGNITSLDGVYSYSYNTTCLGASAVVTVNGESVDSRQYGATTGRLTAVTNHTVFSMENFSGTVLTNSQNNAVMSVLLQMRRQSAWRGIADFYQVRAKVTRRNIL